MACHQRSASLPCLPSDSIDHPNYAEQELRTLKELTISAPAATMDTARDGLRRLGDVYGCVEEMLRLPRHQLGLSSARQRRPVEEELDRSLDLIDLCGAVQESLAEMKTCVRELRAVLKRGDRAGTQLRMDAFVRLAKRAQKPARRTAGRPAAGAAEGCRTLVIVRVMAEAREVGVAPLETAARLLPKQIGGPSPRAASKWSVVAKKFQRRTVVCEEQQLRALERGVGELEDGVEFLFRRMIQSRVSLLNILSS